MEGDRADDPATRDRASLEDRGGIGFRDPVLFQQGRAVAPPASAHHVREPDRLRSAVMLESLVKRSVVACVVAAALARGIGAQGTLGSQGFGYPPGQLSVLSRSVGGATAEVDPLSPINPAALGLLRRGGLYLQSEQVNSSLDAE